MSTNSSSPTILAIDTATEFCSVALLHGGQVAERTEAVGQSHSTVLLPWIENLLREHGVRLNECDAIAFGAGPGAFTGLRIACGVAQGLAWGADRRVVPVGNLAALAWVAARGARRRVACAIDARMQEAYWAVYDVDTLGVTELCPPALSAAADLQAAVAVWQPDCIAGNAPQAFAAVWQPSGAVLPEARATAADIAALAVLDVHAGRTVAPADARPLYVRDRVALSIDERRRQRLASGAAA